MEKKAPRNLKPSHEELENQRANELQACVYEKESILAASNHNAMRAEIKLRATYSDFNVAAHKWHRHSVQLE